MVTSSSVEPPLVSPGRATVHRDRESALYQELGSSGKRAGSVATSSPAIKAIPMGGIGQGEHLNEEARHGPKAAGESRKPQRQARIRPRAAVAQLARASACHAEGRGFESLQPLLAESRSRAGFRRSGSGERAMEPSPRIASILGTSAQNDADARGLATIPPDSASLSPSAGAKFASAKTQVAPAAVERPGAWHRSLHFDARKTVLAVAPTGAASWPASVP